MRTLIATILTVIMTAGPAIGQSIQAQPDDRYKIQLLLTGVLIKGSQEQAARLVGKSSEEQRAILDTPLRRLRVGGAYYLTIVVTDPSGVTTDHSSSGRLRFESFGCLRVKASERLLTVWKVDNSCSNEQQPSLWIIFLDSQGKPIAHNEYLFETCYNCILR